MAGIYTLEDVERKIERIKKWIEIGEKEEKIIIGGDLVASTGKLDGRVWGENEEDRQEKGGQKIRK